MTGLHGLPAWFNCKCSLHSLALMSMSERDLPLLSDRIGGFLKIVFNEGWFHKINVSTIHIPHKKYRTAPISRQIRLGTTGSKVSCPWKLLESVQIQLAEIKPSKPKNNLSHDEYKTLTELVTNAEIIFQEADKGTTTVIVNKTSVIKYEKLKLNSTIENIINLSKMPWQ